MWFVSLCNELAIWYGNSSVASAISWWKSKHRIWSMLHRFQCFSLWFCMAYLYSSSNLVSTFSSYIYYVKMCFFTSFMSWSLARTSYLKDVTDSSYCCIALCSKQKENINLIIPAFLELVLLIKVWQWIVDSILPL